MTYSDTHRHALHVCYISWKIEGSIGHRSGRSSRWWNKTLGIRVELEFLVTPKGNNKRETQTYIGYNKKLEPTLNFLKRTIYHFLTFALGFRVDFSDDNEPTDELGDKRGPEDAATPPIESDPRDVPRKFTNFVSTLPLPDAEPSINSPGDPVFWWDFDIIWDEEGA